MFTESAIESIKIPSTLRVLEINTFQNCRNLREVQLSEGLETVGAQCFYGSGVESIVLPTSVKVVGAGAFCSCERLKTAWLNEGLEILG